MLGWRGTQVPRHPHVIIPHLASTLPVGPNSDQLAPSLNPLNCNLCHTHLGTKTKQ